MTVAIGAMVNARCSAANKHRNLRKSWPHRCMVPKAEQAMPEVLAAGRDTDPCGRAGDRMDVSGAHRHAARNPPQRSPRVQSRPQRHPLGQAEAEAGSVSVNQGYLTRLTREPDAAEITGC